MKVLSFTSVIFLKSIPLIHYQKEAQFRSFMKIALVEKTTVYLI
jgi:hypothetical protein